MSPEVSRRLLPEEGVKLIIDEFVLVQEPLQSRVNKMWDSF